MEEEVDYITEENIRDDISRAIQMIEIYTECSWGYTFDWLNSSEECIIEEAIRLLNELHESEEEASQRSKIGRLH